MDAQNGAAGADAASSLAMSGSMGRIDQLFAQSTKAFSVNLKLEWRIEKFEMLMRLSKNGQHFVSKKFFSTLAPAVFWELHCYPNGKRPEDVGNASFFLRQVGLSHRDDGIRTDFYIYFVNETGGQISVCRDIKEFTAQQGRGKFQNPPTLINTALHSDGALVVVCEAEFIPPACKLIAEEVRKERAALIDEQELSTVVISDALADMLENELMADCRLKVGNKVLLGHKCILAQHSAVFRAMFSMEESKEAKDGIVDITDFEPEHVRALLEFVYTGSVNQRVLSKCPESILAIADKYAVMPLRDYLQRYLASVINVHNLVPIAVIAEQSFASALKKACVRFMALHHRSIIPTQPWRELREKKPDLANELLEMVLDEASAAPLVDATSPQSLDSPQTDPDSGQLLFHDILPFRRGPPFLLYTGDGGNTPTGDNQAAGAMAADHTPQSSRGARRVQPMRRVRQVAVEEQQLEENPHGSQQQQPAAKRTRRNGRG